MVIQILLCSKSGIVRNCGVYVDCGCASNMQYWITNTQSTSEEGFAASTLFLTGYLFIVNMDILSSSVLELLDK